MMEKEAFTNYTLEEEKKKKRDQFTLEVNEKQREKLNDVKELLNIPSDSVAMKIVFEIGLNAMVNTFGRDTLKYLFKKERKKLLD